MKTSLCVAIMFFFLATRMYSQETNFGVKVGYNAASVNVENGTDWDSRSGLHVGGLVHIHINSRFAVQPEVMYSMQGGEKGSTTLKLNYINIPVLLQYMVSDGFRLQTGPQFGFMVSAVQEDPPFEPDVSDQYKSIDFSWAFGAGYIFNSGFGIDARYNLGISNILDNSLIEARNGVFQVGLFYQFRNDRGVKK